jgi:hypothetical protein
MKLKAPLAVALMIGSLPICSVTWAEGRSDGRPEERSRPGSRRPPPPFKGHPPGVHPHGPLVRQHPVRVLAPRRVVRGRHEWARWGHPEFARPVYYWNWGAIHSVSCVAEDSYGDQYPVTEAVGPGPGFGLAEMSSVEDDALDRCYSESGQDPSCYLATCSHF